MTMTLVETLEVGAGGAASIEFASIPQDADDLLLQVSSRNTSTSNALYIYLNNDTTATNYTYRYLMGTGSGVSSATANSNIIALNEPSSFTASTFSNTSLYLPNYGSSAAKSMSVDTVTENNATLSYQRLYASSWTGTSAITSLTIYGSADFAQYSTASLYKITKA